MFDNMEEPLKGTIIFTFVYLAIMLTMDFYSADIVLSGKYLAKVMLKLVIAAGLFHLLRKFFGSDSNTTHPTAE